MHHRCLKHKLTAAAVGAAHNFMRAACQLSGKPLACGMIVAGCCLLMAMEDQSAVLCVNECSNLMTMCRRYLDGAGEHSELQREEHRSGKQEW